MVLNELLNYFRSSLSSEMFNVVVHDDGAIKFVFVMAIQDLTLHCQECCFVYCKMSPHIYQ